MQRALDFEGSRRAKVALEQQDELRRVRESIAGAVHLFLSMREGKRFRAEELRRYVVQLRRCAPESPGRVLRDARNHGWVGVENVDRSGSEYLVTFVKPLSEWVAPKKTEQQRLKERIAAHKEKIAWCEARLAELEEDAA